MLRVPLVCERRDAADDLELHFTIDWPSLEASLRVPSTKLLHWCNPHNPTGRCWTKEELERVASLCVEHDVTLCSDEVWGEVPLEPSAFPFTSMLSLLSDGDGRGGIEGLAERLIVLTSPSKCFNVAPLDIALAVVPNASLRRKFRRAGADSAEVGCFAYAAATAACSRFANRYATRRCRPAPTRSASSSTKRASASPAAWPLAASRATCA